MRIYYRHLQDALIKHFKINEDVPFADLPDAFKAALYYGTNGKPVEMQFGATATRKSQNRSRDSVPKCAPL